MADTFLRELYGNLSRSLALSRQTLLGFAGDLYQVKVIDKFQLQNVQTTAEREGLLAAQSLLTFCQVAIDSNEENKERIVTVMKATESLRNFVPSHSNAVDQQADHVHSSVPQNCGCGNCSVSQWVTGRAQCPKPKRTVVQPVLVVTSDEQDHPVSEFFKIRNVVYNIKLAEDTLTLKRKFTNCYLQTFDELRKIECTQDFNDILHHIRITFFPNQPIPEVANTRQLYDYLCVTAGVTWFNFFPVRFLVSRLNNPDQKIVDIWEDYTSDFKIYCDTRRVKDLSNQFLNQYAEINDSFIVEIDDQYDDIKLSTIESLRDHISEVIGCSATSFFLLAVGIGSLLLLFHYYLDDYLDRFRALSTQQLMELAEFNECIISIKDVDNKFEYPNIQCFKAGSLKLLISPSHSPLISGSSGYASPSDTEMQRLEVNYIKLKQLIVNENRIATAVPILVTLAGLPITNKADVLSELFDAYKIGKSTFTPPESAPGIAWYELVGCPHIDTGELEYQRPRRDTCYIYAAYAALKQKFRILNQIEHFSEADALKVDIFKSPLLNKSFVNFYKTLKEIRKRRQTPFGKLFDRNLPNGFAYINMWDIGLSKAVFHFLPFLNGQLSNNYLWLFFDHHDIKESDLLANIPLNHPDFEGLMLWKPRLYYLMRNIYLTSKMKKTKGEPQCTMILTSDETVTKEESQQCMKKITEKAKEMKMEHLIDSENLCVLDASKRQARGQELKKIGDNTITAGFPKFRNNLPLSWICLRNAFYENSTLYITKQAMKTIAEELLINGSRFDNFLAYFTSFGSIIDASKFGGDSPYIITNPVLFFQKLDKLFYHEDDETFQKYGLITWEGVERIVTKEDADFFLQILLSVNLAVELQYEQLLLPDDAFLADQQLKSAFFIPIGMDQKPNRTCTHFALHLHITAGQVLCRNLQVKFLQMFLKEHTSAKMVLKDKCYVNVTSIAFNGLSFDIVCHGNETEFIVDDKQKPELEIYEAIVDTLHMLLKDLAANEPFFRFKFSFLCCKNASVSKYELQQTCHFLPFTNDCKECEEFMSQCHSLKTWNTILQQDERWKEFPEYENMKEGPFSLDISTKFANSLESLSVDCVDQLARLLKFDEGIQDDSLKGYEGWKRIMTMILGWENESNFYTWQTAKLFRERLKMLLQDPNTSKEDKEIIAITLENCV